MAEDRNKIEAILFTTGKFLDVQDLANMAEIQDLNYLKGLLNELKEEFDNKKTSLEIINEKNRWRLNIRKEYLYLTEKLLTDTELDKPTQETLAIIAYRQPAVQSDIVEIRGNKAYDHIKALKENGFLVSEKFGRTRILKLTPKFYDYFDVVEDNLKEALKLKDKNG